MEIYGIA